MWELRRFSMGILSELDGRKKITFCGDYKFHLEFIGNLLRNAWNTQWESGCKWDFYWI